MQITLRQRGRASMEFLGEASRYAQGTLYPEVQRSVASRVEWVRGVISLRGRIVPVYDLAARLHLSSELTDQTKIVIVEAGSETAGVIVSDVEEVLTVEHEQFEEVPGADSELIDSIAKIGDRLVVLLKSNAIFSNLELAAV